MKLTKEKLRQLILEQLSEEFSNRSESLTEGRRRYPISEMLITEGVNPNNFSVSKWGDFGRLLHTTRTPSSLAGFKGSSVQEKLNNWALDDKTVKIIYNMTKRNSGAVVKWVLKTIPKPAKHSIGNAVYLTSRAGHADIKLQCKPWMSPIWLYDIVDMALDTPEDADKLKNRITKAIKGEAAAKVEEEGPNSKEVKAAFFIVSKAMKEFDEIWEEHAETIFNYVKEWRYLVSQVLQNDPMIIYMIKHGSAVIESIANIEVGGDTIETYVVRDLMVNNFPTEIDKTIRLVCTALDSMIRDPLNSRIAIETKKVMSEYGIPEDDQEEIFGYLEDFLDSVKA